MGRHTASVWDTKRPVNVRAAGADQGNSIAAGADRGNSIAARAGLGFFHFLSLLLAGWGLGPALFIQIFQTQILTFSWVPEASPPKDVGFPTNSDILIFYYKSHPSF